MLKIKESGEFYTINPKFFHLGIPLANAVKDISILNSNVSMIYM